jgi:hypothetical protein
MMNLKRKIGILFIALGITAMANAQDKPLSPPETASGTVNGTHIVINYSSPSVKGREIWGALVPFNEVWRAGANNATVFTIDKDLMVENTKLPAGKYAFFVIPNKDECTIIFNKVAEQWGAYKYEESKDQLRIKVKPEMSAASTEKLVYTISNGKVTLSWEKWNIPIRVK